MSKPKWYFELREKCNELFSLVHALVDESKIGDDITELVASVSPFSISTVEETYKVVTDEPVLDKKGKPVLDKKGKPTFKELFFPFSTLPMIPKHNRDQETTQLEFVDILLWLMSHSFEVDESNPVDAVIHTLRRKNTETETVGDTEVVSWSGVDYSHIIANCLTPNLRTRIKLAQGKIVVPKPKSDAEVAADRIIQGQIVKAQERDDSIYAALRMTYDAMLSMPQGEAAWLKLCADSGEYRDFNSVMVRRAEKDAQEAQEAQEAQDAEEIEVAS
jgi:hypothetical protein